MKSELTITVSLDENELKDIIKKEVEDLHPGYEVTNMSFEYKRRPTGPTNLPPLTDVAGSNLVLKEKAPKSLGHPGVTC